MSENTKIEWCDHTFNPWVGCTKISPACDHCYAEGWAKRSGQVVWGGERKRTSIANWRLPVKWNTLAGMQSAWEQGAAGGPVKPQRPKVFCASLADVFDNAVDPQWRADLFELILATPNLDWLLLTKRIGNAGNMLPVPFDFDKHYPNVWLGATICNQEEADRDIPKLLSVPAAKRFLSMEPLLGAVDISKYMWPVHPRWPAKYKTPKEALADGAKVTYHPQALISKEWADHLVKWVIVGGESGPNARAMLPHWAESLRDQCQTANVPFLFKQWGEWAPEGDNAMRRVGKKAAGRLLDGREWNGVPA